MRNEEIVYNLLYNNSLKQMEKVERINNLDAILIKKSVDCMMKLLT